MKLKKSLKNYKDLVNAVSDVVFEIDTAGTILFLNQAWEKCSGYSLKETLGNSLKGYIESDHWDNVHACITSLRNHEIAEDSVELRIRAKNNSLKWVTVHLKVIDEFSGDLQVLVGTMRNIQREKELVNELKQSHSQNQTILKTVKDVLYTYKSLDLQCDFISDSVSKLGLNKVNFLTKPNYWKEIIFEEDLPAVEFAEQVLAETGNFDLTYRILNEQGDLIWVQNKAWVEKDGFHNARNIHGIYLNITAFKTKEIHLKESEEHFRKMIEFFPFPIIITQIDNERITYLNSTFVESFGISKPGDLLTFIHEGNIQEREKRIIFKLIQTKKQIKGLEIFLSLRADRAPKYFSINSRHLVIGGKKIAVTVLFDIHRSKITEHQNIQLTELLKVLNHIQLNTFISRDFGDSLNDFLLKTMKILGASFGYIGRVVQDDQANERKIIKQVYLNLDDETASNVTFSNLDSQVVGCNELFELTINSKEPLILNESDLQWEKFTECQVINSIRNFAGIPIFKDQELLGFFAFANTVNRVSLKQIEFLNPLTEGYANFLKSIQIGREKEKIEMLKKKSEDMYRFISENTGDIIMLYELDFTIRYVSSAIVRILGYSQNEVLGKKPEEVFQVDFPYSVNFDQPTKLVIPHKRKNSQIFVSLEILLKPLKNDLGEIHAILGTYRDVTERELVLKEVKKNLIKERELNQLKSQFIGMASHEFRTPLATIMSSAELMHLSLPKYENEELGNKLKQHLEKIQFQTNRLSGIISNMLLLEKSVQSDVQIVNKKTPIISCLRRLVKQFEDDSKTEIITYFPSEERTITTEPVLLQHIVQNLLENAVNYSQGISEQVELHLSYLDDFFEIKVRDFGIGIAKEDQKRIFDTFFRGPNVAKIKGTGLGLNIVKEYVQKLNGKIQLESTLGKGTTFTVVFPV